ncbi:uncharacterized protein LOC129591091 isoform X2 [Paramacrobiotus metropolitanus]|nr:uncharacterized protein LOC129591091 isoform X2 [Paramacrobiotus metropolitanus]
MENCGEFCRNSTEALGDFCDFTTGYILDAWTILFNMGGILFSERRRRTICQQAASSSHVNRAPGWTFFKVYLSGMLVTVLLALGAFIHGAVQLGEKRGRVLILIGDMNFVVVGICLMMAAVTLNRGRVPHTFTEWCVGTNERPENTRTSEAEAFHIWMVLSCATELSIMLIIIISHFDDFQEIRQTVFVMISPAWRILTNIFGLSGLFYRDQPRALAPDPRQYSQPACSRFIRIYVGCMAVKAALSAAAIAEAVGHQATGKFTNNWNSVEEGLSLILQAILALPGLLLLTCPRPVADSGATAPHGILPPVVLVSDAGTSTRSDEVTESLLPRPSTPTDEAPPYAAVALRRESDLPPSYAEIMKTTTGRSRQRQ